jgi:hypothetical protein
MASSSSISTAAGMIPAATMSLTALPARSASGKSATRVRTASGRRSSRTVTSVTIPSVPSEPRTTARRSGPTWSAESPPRVTTSPSGVTKVSAETWLVVNPYFRQCAPPEFSATLPPMVHTIWLEGSGAK